MTERRVDKRLLAPVLMGFFIMGFCDIVAPVTNIISGEFAESQQSAVSFLPSMVFLWFLLLSTPVAALMNRIGRKRTAMIGYAFTIAGLLVPYAAGVGSALSWYFIGFGLLGIGNTAIQGGGQSAAGDHRARGADDQLPDRRTDLPQYCSVAARPDHHGAGFAFRRLASVVADLCGAYARLGRLVTGDRGAVADPAQSSRAVGMAECFRLLRNRAVLLCTLGVACFIAADVGIGFVSVRLIDNPDSILTTTGFYALRIVGTLVGAWVLIRVVDVKYLRWNMLLALALCIALFAVRSEAVVYALVGILGFTMACVFATFYAVATKSAPGRSNEVAGLMILAISAGALSGPICGALIRGFGHPQAGLIWVTACVCYLLWAAAVLKSDTKK